MCTSIVASMPMAINAEETSSDFNYAEVLQKSLYFYEVQQSGELPDWNIVEWRGDSTTNDYITGGWFDAGDHIKFNLPMAYSATMLAWGLYAYGDGVEAVGLTQMYEDNLNFVLDYLARCDLGDEVVYQIGEGGADHKWWGSAELIELEMERPYYTCKASCVTGEMAAALASGALALGEDDENYDYYIEHAKNLFEIADTTRSDEDYTEANGYYNSWSGFWDELFWSANWLYMATGDEYYLDKATSYIPNLNKMNQSTELSYSWAHCWDDVTQGAMLLYAMNTGDSQYIAHVNKHLDTWVNGTGDVKYTPGGLAYMSQWGALRYATTSAFLAGVWSDYLADTDATASQKYEDFAESQINYALGDNPNNISYVIGYGDTYPQNPHHRTSQGAWEDQSEALGYHRHILYGALVGGPNSDDSYGENEDKVTNFTNNEVATDYNAGFTALLCKMVSEYGGETDDTFPQPEEKDLEYYMQACINQDNANFTELKVLATNHTAWPARYSTNLSYRYYFDVSEIVDAGYSVDDITITKGYDEWSDTEVSQPIQYDGNIYYVEITYSENAVVAPIGKEQESAELQFRIAMPDATNVWDPSNDYSFAGLSNDTSNLAITDKITMYDNGVLIWGTEPDGTTPDTSTPIVTTPTETTVTTSETTQETDNTTSDTTPFPEETDVTTSNNNPSNTLLGDVNEDEKVNSADLLILKKSLLGLTELSEQGNINADVTSDGKVNSADLLLLKKFLLGLIETF